METATALNHQRRIPRLSTGVQAARTGSFRVGRRSLPQRSQHRGISTVIYTTTTTKKTCLYRATRYKDWRLSRSTWSRCKSSILKDWDPAPPSSSWQTKEVIQPFLVWFCKSIVFASFRPYSQLGSMFNHCKIFHKKTIRKLLINCSKTALKLL